MSVDFSHLQAAASRLHHGSRPMQNIRYPRNLAQRLPKPAQGTAACNGPPSSSCPSRDGYDSTGRRIEPCSAGLRLGPQHYRAVRRALRHVGAEPVDRGGGRGRPTIWRLPELTPRTAHYPSVDFQQRGKSMRIQTAGDRAPTIANTSVTRTRRYLTGREVERLLCDRCRKTTLFAPPRATAGFGRATARGIS